jgi:hypothetical protein
VVADHAPCPRAQEPTDHGSLGASGQAADHRAARCTHAGANGGLRMVLDCLTRSLTQAAAALSGGAARGNGDSHTRDPCPCADESYTDDSWAQPALSA